MNLVYEDKINTPKGVAYEIYLSKNNLESISKGDVVNIDDIFYEVEETCRVHTFLEGYSNDHIAILVKQKVHENIQKERGIHL